MSSAAITRLPPAITAPLLADGGRIASRLSRRLADEITLPPEFRTRPYLRAVVRASHDGLLALLRHLHDGRRLDGDELAALGQAGVRQAELGVPLEVLLRGYRLAAKVVWREVVDEATRLGALPPEMVVSLSEEVLEYLDGISGAVGSAYLETRERLVRQRDRERDRLLQRLLAGDTSAELRRLAATHDLDLSPPFLLLALAAVADADPERQLAAAWRRARPLLTPDQPGTWIALVAADADPELLAAAAADAMPGLVIGAGPVAATLEEVAPAALRARDALIAGRRLHPGRVVHHDREVGLFAILLAEPERLGEHVRHVLGPLLDSGDARRRQLLPTLEAVITAGGLADAAEQLRIHRHTVVYRLGRIRELLGVDPDEPAERHRLWLALECHRLLGGDAEAGAAGGALAAGGAAGW